MSYLQELEGDTCQWEKRKGKEFSWLLLLTYEDYLVSGTDLVIYNETQRMWVFSFYLSLLCG